jgi:hypothetical protein
MADERHQAKEELAGEADQTMRRRELVYIFTHRAPEKSYREGELREHQHAERDGAHCGARRGTARHLEASNYPAARNPRDGKHERELE